MIVYLEVLKPFVINSLRKHLFIIIHEFIYMILSDKNWKELI